VAAKLYQHAQAAWRGRPRQQQLGALLEEEYQAVARLRQGVLVALQATYTLVRDLLWAYMVLVYAILCMGTDTGYVLHDRLRATGPCSREATPAVQ
jgi:hypothetical protein